MAKARSNQPPLRVRIIRMCVKTAAGCWEWRGSADDSGYGVIRVKGRMRKVHVVMWEIYHGQPVPKGKQLDHIPQCRNRRCCYPLHLEPVTPGENKRRAWVFQPRSPTCPRGHVLPPSRRCKICRRQRRHRELCLPSM
ncbi:MAG TPA: HNH endonuclease signature motif containing protein [Candidatus Acidoferrales bacterium]|nr:HNH endonuclease signature motif containing protein [Candidatus Acidoferrales bacterium]